MQYKKLDAPVERNQVYEHYRGNRYVVIDIAKNADGEGDIFCIVYRALYDHGQLYVTSIERFTSLREDGSPRFRKIEIEEQNRNSGHVYPTITM